MKGSPTQILAWLDGATDPSEEDERDDEEMDLLDEIAEGESPYPPAVTDGLKRLDLIKFLEDRASNGKFSDTEKKAFVEDMQDEYHHFLAKDGKYSSLLDETPHLLVIFAKTALDHSGYGDATQTGVEKILMNPATSRYTLQEALVAYNVAATAVRRSTRLKKTRRSNHSRL